MSLAAQLGYHERPIVPLEWQREAAIEVLGIEGESYSMTGAGTKVNNINVELALAQPAITRDYRLQKAAERSVIVSCQLGATLVRGGEYPSRNFATTANSAAASLVGAIIPTQDKATVIGGVKVARGQRKGDRFIAAENDSFNMAKSKKLFDFVPQ